MAKNKKIRYIEIAEKLMEDIRSGKYKAGEKIYSRAKLSAQFHISAVTAVRVQDYLVSRGYVRKVHGSGVFVNYDSNSLLMKLEKKNYPEIKRIIELRYIGNPMNDFASEFYQLIDEYIKTKKIEYQLKEYDYSEVSMNAINTLPLDPDAGYFIFSIGSLSISYSIGALINPCIHNVLLDGLMPETNCVLTDSFDGMEKIVDYAVETGCKRFIFAKNFVDSLGNLYNEERCYAGMYHCRRHGYECTVIDSASYNELIEVIGKSRMKTCVMFPQDEGAVRLKKLLKSKKKSNVLITGFDDYAGFEGTTESLTTIRINKRKMVETAIDILTGPHVIRKKIVRIPGDLIIRD